MGRPAARLAEARAVNARVGDRLFLPLIHDATGWLERSRGRYEQALAEGRTAVALAAPGGRARWSAWTHATLGWTLLDMRAAEAAVAVLERALAASELLADRLRAAGHLAWARTLAGDSTGAVTASDLAEQALAQLKAPPGGTFLFGFGAIVALARAELAAGAAIGPRPCWHRCLLPRSGRVARGRGRLLSRVGPTSRGRRRRGAGTMLPFSRDRDLSAGRFPRRRVGSTGHADAPHGRGRGCQAARGVRLDRRASRAGHRRRPPRRSPAARVEALTP